MSFELIPIYDTKAILKNWKFFREGMKCVEEYSASLDTVDTLYNRLMSQEVLMWAAYKDGDYDGFIVTKPILDALGQWHTLIYALYGNGGQMDEGWWEQGLQRIEAEARKHGQKTVQGYTVRKGMLKMIEPFGYKVERYLFSKEV